MNEFGIREILGVSAKLSEAEVHWRSFLENLQSRGLKGVEIIVSDDHSGLGAARNAVLPSVPWQRCVFHLAQNAQAYCPSISLRKDLTVDVREVFRQKDYSHAMIQVKEVCKKWQKTAPDFSSWFEVAAEEGMTFYMFKSDFARKRIRTNNVVERLNEEIRRRTRVARLFPNESSCLRLVSAVLMEVNEKWASSKVYLSPEKLKLDKNYRKLVA